MAVVAVRVFGNTLGVLWELLCSLLPCSVRRGHFSSLPKKGRRAEEVSGLLGPSQPGMQGCSAVRACGLQHVQILCVPLPSSSYGPTFVFALLQSPMCTDTYVSVSGFLCNLGEISV